MKLRSISRFLHLPARRSREMAFITLNFVYWTLGVIAAGFLALYIHFRYKYRHWNKLGIKELRPASFPYGHFQGFLKTKTLSLLLADMYQETKNEKFVGIYCFKDPFLMINDLDLAKLIMVKDFNHFVDRGIDIEVNQDVEPLSGHLVALNGKKWRNLRVQLTPTFTSGKMKMIFTSLIEVGKQLHDVLNEATGKDEVEVKDILARYSTDVIASCAFGIDNNSLKNPENEFRKMGLELTKPTIKQMLLGLVFLVFPKLFEKLPFSITPKHINEFFIGIVKDTMKYREDNNTSRNDFMQLLLELKNVGYVKDADNPKESKPEGEIQKFTYNQAAAQAFLFFVAGFETTASTMQFTLYELALNPELQAKARSEVDSVMKKHGGQITYESLFEMHLLDRIVSETLRKYAVGASTIRSCTKEYKIPGTDVTLKEGAKVWFPIYGYHHDPQYFPDPEKFDPDRFLPEEKEKRHNFAYMPFGEGPRNCIGIRFALMQVKTTTAIFLSGFNVSPSKSTPIPMVFDPTSDILTPKAKMHLKISKRED